MKENNKTEASTEREIQIGGGTYIIERVFTGTKTADELIVERILSEKQRLSKEQIE